MQKQADNIMDRQQIGLLMRIAGSYTHWTGQSLCPAIHLDSSQQAQWLHAAPWALLAHDGQPDPVFIYGNQQAQSLFAMDMATLCRTPSRLSAERPLQHERAQLLETVARQGFISHYSGIRISSEGRRFRIQDAWVWNLLDDDGQACGQAACFDRWTWL
ncbi:MAG: hypothetical protein RIQ52_1137 [Pseudomonadota bacterium]